MPDDSLAERLGSSADRIAQLAEALELEQERRNEMVRAARAEGWPWKRVALAARLSTTRCCVIVADG